MESFACLIQTHTGQDKGGTERRNDRKKGAREACRERDRKRERVEEEKHKVQERQITETGRQGGENEKKSELEKIALPPLAPTPPHLYLSKESSVLAQELKPLSPCAGALCPGAPASFGAEGCRVWLA